MADLRTPNLSAEDFVRMLLWDDFPECCGSPVVDYGGEYMGQREEVLSCCGCPEPARLSDAQIVAALRERFPEQAPQRFRFYATNGDPETGDQGDLVPVDTPGVDVPAKLVTHCPWCAAPVSVADEPYCANADCRWNNGGTAPNRTDEARDLIRRLVDAIDGNGATGDYLQRLRDEADLWLATQAARGVEASDGDPKRDQTPIPSPMDYEGEG